MFYFILLSSNRHHLCFKILQFKAFKIISQWGGGGIIKKIYPDYFSISIYLGSMCNNATDWPALPDVPTVEKEPVPVSTEQNSHIIKLLLAVICPVAILGKHFSHISSQYIFI